MLFGDENKVFRLLVTAFVFFVVSLMSVVPTFLCLRDSVDTLAKRVYASPVPAPGPGLPPIDPSRPVVALTFDDGPCSGVTSSILDTLLKHQVVATFFVVGDRLKGHEHLLDRMAKEGHEIGNHGYSHKKLTSLPQDELTRQVEATQSAVSNASGYTPQLLRPAYGLHDDAVRQGANMPLVLWSLDPRDWQLKDAEKVCQAILDKVKDGDIVLMHDIHKSTAVALELLIPQLLNRSFQFVTVSQAFQACKKPCEAGSVYYRIPRPPAKKD